MQFLLPFLAAIVVGINAQSSIHRAPIRGPVGIRSGGNFARGGAACAGNPCGPNTRCEESNAGFARCRCLEGYVPDGNTINGCKHECDRDGDCSDEQKCQRNQCVNVCGAGACGLHADCDARNHQAQCKCPSGYTGDGSLGCSVFVPQVRAASPAAPINPCHREPCGIDAVCTQRQDTPVCSCPFGYEGDPLTRCIKAECTSNAECRQHQACQGQKCIDPCQIHNICGTGAECEVKNHQPVCSCGARMTGDPFKSCRLFRAEEYCEARPCGENTICKPIVDNQGNGRAQCSCIANYIGDPLTGCRAECIRDSDCPSARTCRENRCANPCAYNACGESAICNVRNNRVTCTCPEYFKGDPHSRCYAECTEHSDCNQNQACSKLQCLDPCVGACGTGADCHVKNHQAICSCPKDMTGHPFESCRPFTDADLCADNPCGTGADCNPGTDRQGNKRPVCSCPRGFIGNAMVSCVRGECDAPEDCARSQDTCFQHVCQNACVLPTGSVCGEYAECKVNRQKKPVCSCPVGYEGNPLESCYAPTPSQLRSGRF